MKLINKKITIIGAGKFAHSFAAALINSGFKIEMIISRNLRSAGAFSKIIGVLKYSNDLSALSNDCNLVFICVQDDQIKKVAAKISKLRLQFQKITFVHTSGVKTSDELISLKNKGALTASFHLMQTFPSKKIFELKNTFTAIESESVFAQNELMQLAKLLKLDPALITSDDKILYHIGGVFAANFLSANFLSAEVVLPNKFKKRAPKILSPIAKSALENIVNLSAAKAISGPIDRGDTTTVDIHLRALKLLGSSVDNRLILLSYLIQSRILLNGIRKKYGRLSSSQRKIKKNIDAELKKVMCTFNSN